MGPHLHSKASLMTQGLGLAKFRLPCVDAGRERRHTTRLQTETKATDPHGRHCHRRSLQSRY
jgi:hypothetical protein